MPAAHSKLTKHLQKYSTKDVRGIRKLYNQWKVIEVRDSGKSWATARCPCGRTGLRYICFIRNRYTKAETYVGATCAEHFHRSVPRLLKTLEILSMRGVTVKYKGKGPGCLLFQMKCGSKLVKSMGIMRRFFTTLPYSFKNGAWELRVRLPYGKRSRFATGKWYNIRVDGGTSQKRQGRCALHFYLTKSGPAYR